MTDLVDFVPELVADYDGLGEPRAVQHVLNACIEFCDKSDFVRSDLSVIYLSPYANTFTLSAPSSEVLISSIISARYEKVDSSGNITSQTFLKMRDERIMNRLDPSWRDKKSASPEYGIRLPAGGSTWSLRIAPYADTATDSGDITAITAADPAIVTSVSHGLSDGKRVYVSGVSGMTQVNGTQTTITVVDDDRFSLDGVDATSYDDYTSGGTWGTTDGRLTVQVSTKPARTATTVDDRVFDDFYEHILSGARARIASTPNKPWYEPGIAVLHDQMFQNGIREARFKMKEGDADRSEGLVMRPISYVKRSPRIRMDSDFDHEDI